MKAMQDERDFPLKRQKRDILAETSVKEIFFSSSALYHSVRNELVFWFSIEDPIFLDHFPSDKTRTSKFLSNSEEVWG